MSFTECFGTHNRGAVCWRCSDAKPWWRELRIKRGLGAEPRQPSVPVKRRVPLWEKFCTSCGKRVHTEYDRCYECRTKTWRPEKVSA